jgi:site-specific DNA-methyltransferase (cytosine-N4-specific)
VTKKRIRRKKALRNAREPERLTGAILEGDAGDVLTVLPDSSVQCVVTSPPYWGVRDYNVAGQIGLEPKLEDYLVQIQRVFKQVWRVMKPDGVLWLNVGDVFSSGNRKYRAPDGKYPQRAMSSRPPTPNGLKAKDLIAVPWRLALALQNAGWYLRTEVIWHKPNAMPESVQDRPARAHEYLFLFSKSERYKFSRSKMENGNPQIKRNIWSIPTGKSEVDGHNAVFPEALISPCIKAATDEGDVVLDPFCGTGTVGHVSLKLNRRFVGIELNPSFAKAAVKRFGKDVCWMRLINPKTAAR